MSSRLGGREGGHQKTREEVAVIARRERMEGGAVEGEYSLDSGQILWEEPTRFLGRLDVGVRERRVKDNTKVSGLNH